MNEKNLKNKHIENYTNLLKDYLLHNNFSFVNKTNINNLINKTKLTKKDYKKIKKDLLKNQYYINNIETENIIKIISQKLKNFKLEYSLENSDYIFYFHFKNNTSYLVNYDSINKKWYLSLIQTNTLITIKEIYNGNYDNFLKYIKIAEL